MTRENTGRRAASTTDNYFEHVLDLIPVSNYWWRGTQISHESANLVIHTKEGRCSTENFFLCKTCGTMNQEYLKWLLLCEKLCYWNIYFVAVKIETKNDFLLTLVWSCEYVLPLFRKMLRIHHSWNFSILLYYFISSWLEQLCRIIMAICSYCNCINCNRMIIVLLTA